MKGGAAKRHRCIDRQSSFRKFRQDVMIHPGAKPGPLGGITPLDPEDADFDLHESDRGEVKGRGVHAGQPSDDIGVGFAVADLA